MVNVRRIKYACYSTNVCMAIIANLPPILFIVFHDMYAISYTLLGLLIFLNFATQLAVDMVFSLWSHKFNIELTVKVMPYITTIGFIFYAVFPLLANSHAYIGLVIGTIIFSSASGLGEVLMSPLIASLPSDNPDKDMSALHSVYAWGVVFVVIIGTLFLWFVGREYWFYLVFAFTIVPIISIILFQGVHLPNMPTPKKTANVLTFLKNKMLWLSLIAIFIGGACECTMAQWSSTYIEQALGLPKIYGDLFGVALFSVFLAIGRSLYAKIGKNIELVLLVSAVCTLATYSIAIFVNNPIIGLIGCASTGLFVAMLWPGNIIVASKRFGDGGVFLFAIMAAAGDLGGSVVPQLVGIVADGIMANPDMVSLASSLSLTPEQLGLKAGLLFASIFAIIGIIVFTIMLRTKHKYREDMQVLGEETMDSTQIVGNDTSNMD